MFNFYVEYNNGKALIESNLTKLQAKRRYNAYAKNPEFEAKAWGWEESNPYTLSQQIRQLKRA